MRLPSLFLPLFALLSGCASQTELTAIRLDPEHPKYQTTACRESREGSAFHRDAREISMVASPLLVVLSGSLLLPVVAANAGLDYVDRVDASNMATRCGGRGEQADYIAREVTAGAALNAVTGGAAK